MMLVILLSALVFVQSVTAHVAAHGPGMFCRNGLKYEDDINSNEVVHPLYQLDYNDWWMHGLCKNYPPPEGDILNLPAGGSFKIELASNRAMTSLSYDGTHSSAWPDGGPHPELENYANIDCIVSPNLHTKGQNVAAGTAFAISYTSDIFAVKPETLAVFSVLEHTPWKREVFYQVPSNMPACPKGGCICAWGWVPNGCGEPNMFMNPFRCNVTGATSTTPVATAKPPRWCEDDDSACVKGAKQMVSWHQLTGNNIEVDGFDRSGDHKSPGYNMKLGFSPGAQNDIFDPSSQSSPPQNKDTPSSSEGTPTTSSTPSYTPPTNSGTTSTSKPRRSNCPRSPSRRANLVKKSSFAAHHKRRQARQHSNRSI